MKVKNQQLLESFAIKGSREIRQCVEKHMKSKKKFYF